MSVIGGLMSEHEIFKGLADRLEKSLDYEEPALRSEVRDTLLILLPALDVHEEIEETVFGHPLYASKEEAKLLLGETEYQHGQIQKLRAELIAALQTDSPESLPLLKILAADLVKKLRLHFETEEKRLWPHYRAYSRSMDKSIKRRLREQVRQLRKGIDDQRFALADYFGIRK